MQEYYREYEKKCERQWVFMRQLEKKIILWAEQQNCSFHRIDFFPHGDGEIVKYAKSLEIYVFYRKNKELTEYQANGIAEKTKDEIKRILAELGYFKEFSEDIRFEFDTHENVKKNYKGSYFYRFR